MRILTAILFLCLIHSLVGQVEFEADTLHYFDRTAGDLDSADVSLSLAASTVDGNYFALDNRFFSHQALLKQYTLMQCDEFSFRDKIKFSALPRIGFHYSFGAQGTQFFHANYVQAFNHHFLVNITYDRGSSTGYLRNNNFEKHDLQLKLRGKWEHYDFLLNTNYKLKKVAYAAGLADDSLVGFVPLDFLPVNKANANSRFSAGLVSLQQRINLGDSVRRYGIQLRSELDISNRKYLEQDTIYGLYNSYVDSFTTYDQYNLPSVTNMAGLFASLGAFYVDLNYGITYWEFQNSGLYTDTLQHDLYAQFIFKKNKLDLQNDLKFNLVGNYQGFTNRSTLSYSISKLSRLHFFHLIQSEPPIQYIRHYRSNNFNFDQLTINKQFVHRAGLGFTQQGVLDSLLNTRLQVSYLNVTNAYIWDGSKWSSDAANRIELISFNLGLDLRWKAIRMRNDLTYNASNSDKLPKLMYNGRIYLQHDIFQSKKMRLQYGVDLAYYSSFEERAFVPAVDAFQWNSIILLDPILNMHAFAGFQIDEFKFYFRFENIGVFWNDQKRTDITAYPLATSRIRIGVVWDFFN